MKWAAEFHIGQVMVGFGHPCYVIAAIALAPNATLESALGVLDAAHHAGANAARFPFFSPEFLAAKRIINTKGRFVHNRLYDTLEQLAMPMEWLPKLWRRAEEIGIELLITPYDIERLAAWVEIGGRAIRLSSGDLTYAQLVRATAASGIPLLLACGMSDEQEVATALRIIDESGGREVALLHSVTSNPVADEEMNLRVLPSLAQQFELPVGFSDHSEGWVAPIGAVALGACILEKNLTLEYHTPLAGEPPAVTPGIFARMVTRIRRMEKMLGSGIKTMAVGEAEERTRLRRSILAARPLRAGTILSPEDLKCVRPEGGLPPVALIWILGKTVRRDLKEDEIILESDIQ